MSATERSDARMRAIAHNVKTVRQKRGLSQVELARRSNTSRSLIARFESTGTDIRIESLCRIADALRVRVRDLVSDTSES